MIFIDIVITNNFMFHKKLLLLFLLLFISNCADKIDPTTGEKIIIEPNPQTKAKQFADKRSEEHTSELQSH